MGENGVGKSTLLEALAARAGFALQSGTRNFPSDDAPPPLAAHLRLSWLPKVGTGFFLRAESYFNLASRIDELDRDGGFGPRIIDSYGGVSLHAMSHGEAFLALFENKFGAPGLYIVDEPEAALSPSRQVRFLKVLRRMERSGRAQILIATHAPLIMAYPGADLVIEERNGLRRGRPQETTHWQMLNDFFGDPDEFYNRHLGPEPELP